MIASGGVGALRAPVRRHPHRRRRRGAGGQHLPLRRVHGRRRPRRCWRATAFRCASDGAPRGAAARGAHHRRPVEAQQAAGGRPARACGRRPTACARRCSTGSARTCRGWRCLDAFAGSGALGFEAASRGAAEVVLLERDPTLVAQPAASQAAAEGRRAARRARRRAGLDGRARAGGASTWCFSTRRSTRRSPCRRWPRRRGWSCAAASIYLEARAGVVPATAPRGWALHRQAPRRRGALPPVAARRRRLSTPGYTAARISVPRRASLDHRHPLTAVYPGTFDPMTLGPRGPDAPRRRLFDRLILAVAAGHHKRTMFTIAERLEMAHGDRRALPERRGDGLSRPAARLRRRPRRRGGGARPARGERLRVRVPDGRHEPPADARGGDAVPDAVGPVPVRLRHLRARDCHLGR